MKKKPAASTQVRISEHLSGRIDNLRDKCGFRVSRSAFVETLLWRGIAATEQSTNPSGDTAESTLKK